MVAAKLSIALQLFRVTTDRIHIWIIYSAVALTMMTNVVFFFVTFFQCHPFYYFWDKSQPGACLADNVFLALAYFYNIWATVNDLLLGFLPIAIVHNLHTDLKTRIMLVPILGMGCMSVCIP